MKWTDKQQQVIDRRGRNLLVSAAAGSGKTAVLIERIMALLTDPEAPCDIDRLLVVTFTKAAASEMAERLQRRIEEALYLTPDDPHLRQQLLLIHNAQITTIDGFSAFVLREYGVRIGLGSTFRIAAEGEAELLCTETLEQLLTKEHAEASPEFEDFVETFATGKTEDFLGDLILRLYDSAMAMPHPSEWLDRLRDDLSADGPDVLLSSGFFRAHLAGAGELIRRGARLADENLALVNAPAGPAYYHKTAESDQKLFAGLAENADDYGALRSLLAAFKPERLGTSKPGPSQDPALRGRYRTNRDEINTIRKQLLEEYFPYPLKTALEFERKSAGPLLILLALVKKFNEAFSAAKRDRGILDFADLEQLALRVLTNEDGSPSDAAADLQDRFLHVMIDEYQDSNDLQEALLTAVSRISRGEMNYFNVGDIKQSIYSFRQARPELFLQKYSSYPLSPEGLSESERIDLHRNFRSRPEVTDAVNLIFSQIMRSEVGGVTYDTHSALIPGAFYPSEEEIGPGVGLRQDGASEDSGHASGQTGDTETVRSFLQNRSAGNGNASGHASGPYQTECMLVYTTDEAFPDGDGLPSESQLESRAIGERIRTMIRGERIYDKDLDAYRPVRYSDIVILTRSGGDFVNVLSRTLTAMDIPVHRTLRKGYFSAKEVRLVLDYLRILDNPRQDIPLAAVLHSAFAGLSAKDLAAIRTETAGISPMGLAAIRTETAGISPMGPVPGFPKTEVVSPPDPDRADNESGSSSPGRVSAGSVDFYDRVRYYAAYGSEPAIREALTAFFTLYDDLRARSIDTPAYELLSLLFERSGFAARMSAGPGGAQRETNLTMLTEKARVYEETSFTGIRHFIRYIDQLREYEIDFGESQAAGGEENLVRIMTIHKSKGLEFPVVFVAGLARRMNKRDASANVLIHPSGGIASVCLDHQARFKAPTLKYLSLKQKILADSMGEELRVLYVAMTRAQQKLILTQTCRSPEKAAELTALVPSGDLALPAGLILKASSFRNLILPAVFRQNADGVRAFMESVSGVSQDAAPSGAEAAAGAAAKAAAEAAKAAAEAAAEAAKAAAGAAAEAAAESAKAAAENHRTGSALPFIPIRITEVRPQDLIGAEVETAARAGLFYQELLKGTTSKEPEDETGSGSSSKSFESVGGTACDASDTGSDGTGVSWNTVFEERFSYRYPFAEDRFIPEKVSVSEIKAAHHRDEDAFGLFDEPPVIPYIPAFARNMAEDSPVAESNPSGAAGSLIADETASGSDAPPEARTVSGSDALSEARTVSGSDALSEARTVSGSGALPEARTVSGSGALPADKTSSGSPGTAVNALPAAGPGGAHRGSAMHRFLELVDYADLPYDLLIPSVSAAMDTTDHDGEDHEASIRDTSIHSDDFALRAFQSSVETQIRHFTEEGLLTEEEASLILPRPIAVFLTSDLGQRMHAASARGQLRREQPFTLSLPADEVDPSWPSYEAILVQGIIDAFFEENGGLVLVDYKTDRVSPEDGAVVLTDRYAVQLTTYAKALERLLEKPVLEIFIFSLALGQAIPL